MSNELPEEYTLLFNKITDILQVIETVYQELKAAQQEAEELYISREN